MLARICMSNMDIKPLIVMDKDREKAGMVASLLMLAMTAASYPLLYNTRRFVFYYGLFVSIFAFVSFCFRYWKHSHNSIVVFKMDESGIYFHDKGSQFYEWSELKQVSVRFTSKENGKMTRLLFVTTQEGADYRFNLFYFVVSYVWTIRRLKKSVPYFSKRRVPFKYYPIWNKSFDYN